MSNSRFKVYLVGIDYTKSWSKIVGIDYTKSWSKIVGIDYTKSWSKIVGIDYTSFVTKLQIQLYLNCKQSYPTNCKI